MPLKLLHWMNDGVVFLYCTLPPWLGQVLLWVLFGKSGQGRTETTSGDGDSVCSGNLLDQLEVDGRGNLEHLELDFPVGAPATTAEQIPASSSHRQLPSERRDQQTQARQPTRTRHCSSAPLFSRTNLHRCIAIFTSRHPRLTVREVAWTLELRLLALQLAMETDRPPSVRLANTASNNEADERAHQQEVLSQAIATHRRAMGLDDAAYDHNSPATGPAGCCDIRDDESLMQAKSMTFRWQFCVAVMIGYAFGVFQSRYALILLRRQS